MSDPRCLESRSWQVWWLIDAMGDATRDESAAIARRFALIGELDARRAREWEERNLWCTAPYEAVAAEISAAQNISRGRASGQIHYARVLRDELPEVAAVFATGVIDIRMVLTIIARIENVEDEVMPRLDAALARHAPKWMKLSGPKLRDRIDLWVAKFGCLAGVAATAPGRVVLVIAHMLGHLRVQRGLQHILRELVEQPVGADQLDALFLRLRQQLLSQLPLIHFVRHRIECF
jgi:Domain of unknown function (DUF222)